MSDSYIRHIVPAPEFRALADTAPYRPSQFDADGFIHCTSTAEVLLQVANTFYKNAPGEFLVLVIDPARLTAPLKYEPPSPPPPPGHPFETLLFPHIYGDLNRDAIIAIQVMPRAADGTFLEV